MADAIAVLNAGSSSIDFSLFVRRGGELELELELRGQVEGIYTMPHFIAKRRGGPTAAEKSWAEGTKLGHDCALDHLVAFLRSELADDRLYKRQLLNALRIVVLCSQFREVLK